MTHNNTVVDGCQTKKTKVVVLVFATIVVARVAAKTIPTVVVPTFSAAAVYTAGQSSQSEAYKPIVTTNHKLWNSNEQQALRKTRILNITE